MTNENKTTPPLSAKAIIARKWAEQQRDDRIREVAAKTAMAALLRDASADDADSLQRALLRQGHILDRMFADKIKSIPGSRHASDNLELAMKMQRECRHTAQAISRIRYLGSLADKNSGKRTDSSAAVAPENREAEDGRAKLD
jgi:hypothetical protein